MCIIRSNFIGNGGVKFYNNTEKHMYTFTINGYKYTAEWNHIRNNVSVSNNGLGKEFEVIKTEHGFTEVMPCFNWQDTSEQRKKVGNFLEGTNIVEVCESIYKNDPDRRENKLKSRRLRTLERAAAHELFCEDGTTPLSLEAAQDYINELEWKVKNADYKARNPEVL